MSKTRGSNKKLYVILGAVIVGMSAFSFALVPLYNVFCKSLGLNGKTGGRVAYHATKVDESRWVTVEFVTTKNESLPWAFHPNVTKVKVHPGALSKVTFYAKNQTDHNMTVQAIPSVTPGLAAKYLKKTECFCFTRQSLAGEHERNMPLVFHLDPNLPKNINTLTLSYTLFDVSDRPG